MTDKPDELLEQIRSLDEVSAVEAAQLLGIALGVEGPPGSVGSELFANPLQARPDIADLCRLTLLVAATDATTRELVQESLAGVGQRQLILGGAELVLLGGLALGALHICVSGGKTMEETIEETRSYPDGRTQVTVRRQVQYGISSRLAGILRALNPLQ